MQQQRASTSNLHLVYSSNANCVVWVQTNGHVTGKPFTPASGGGKRNWLLPSSCRHQEAKLPQHVLWVGLGGQSFLKRSMRPGLWPVWLESKSAAPMQNSAAILLEFSQGSMKWLVRVSGSRNGLCLTCLCKQVVNTKPNSVLVCSI